MLVECPKCKLKQYPRGNNECSSCYAPLEDIPVKGIRGTALAAPEKVFTEKQMQAVIDASVILRQADTKILIPLGSRVVAELQLKGSDWDKKTLSKVARAIRTIADNFEDGPAAISETTEAQP